MARIADSDFLIKVAEHHERCWGNTSYADRPKLQAILDAHIVAVWYPARRAKNCLTITLHEDIHEIEAYMSKIVIAYKSRLPDRRLRYLFVDKKQVIISGISLIIDTP